VKAGHARYTLFPGGDADCPALPSVLRDLQVRTVPPCLQQQEQQQQQQEDAWVPGSRQHSAAGPATLLPVTSRMDQAQSSINAAGCEPVLPPQHRHGPPTARAVVPCESLSTAALLAAAMTADSAAAVAAVAVAAAAAAAV